MITGRLESGASGWDGGGPSSETKHLTEAQAKEVDATNSAAWRQINVDMRNNRAFVIVKLYEEQKAAEAAGGVMEGDAAEMKVRRLPLRICAVHSLCNLCG